MSASSSPAENKDATRARVILVVKEGGGPREYEANLDGEQEREAMVKQVKARPLRRSGDAP